MTLEELMNNDVTIINEFNGNQPSGDEISDMIKENGDKELKFYGNFVKINGVKYSVWKLTPVYF